MTSAELCLELACPPDTPAGGLLAAWERRRAELDEALAGGAQARPVKLRLREERRRLDAAETLAVELRSVAEFDAYLAEFGREAAQAAPAGAVLRLCLEKARPLAARMGDPSLRFACEKRLAEAESALESGPAARPVPGPDHGSLRPPTGRVPVAEDPPAGRRRSAPAEAPRLELAPLTGGETPRRIPPRIRFITTECFSLGRQSTADYPVRYALDTEENRSRLATISRVHTRLLARGGRLFVADGPSRNGTIVDEQRLLSPEPVPVDFARERRLVLGQFGFEVRVQFFSEGYLRFLPPASADRSTLPVWLLEAATIGSAPTAAVRLEPPAPPLAARVAYSPARGFTIEIPAAAHNHLAGATLDEIPLSPGTSTPLQHAQTLAIGPAAFRVLLS